MITIESFRRFKEGCQCLNEEIRASSFRGFTTKFRDLESGYRIARKRYDEWNRQAAESFNIFSILNVGSYEVRMHTPFLSELLDISGTHGQGNLFLSSFLRLVGLSKDESEREDWRVIKEREHIDLRLVNCSLGKAVFIENKVDTGAHDGQLSRYYKKWERDFNCNGAFIYLSPSGAEPEASGYDDGIYPRVEIEAKLKRLSYKVHIANWLMGLIEQKQIYAPRALETVRQYIDLINSWS